MFSSTSPEAGIYAEHFDSICEKDDIAQISSFLNDLSLDNIHNQTIILYVSPNNISDSVWSPVLEKFIHLELVYILCIDKYHYITSTRHHFRPGFPYKYWKNRRSTVDQVSHSFWSTTMAKASMYHMSLMLHPQSTVATSLQFKSDMGLDDSSVVILNIDQSPTRFFTSLIWEYVERDDIDVRIEFTTN